MQFCFIRIKAFFTGVNVGGENILLDLSGLLINRRTAQVTLQLVNAGYTVFYKAPARLYVDTVFDGSAEYLNLFFETARYKNPFIKFQAVFCSENNRHPYPKKIVFFDDIPAFRDHCTESFFFPILFHPLKMKRNSEETVSLPPRENKINMIFVGNNDNTYTKQGEIIHDRYGMKTRNEVIDFLKNRFIDQVYCPDCVEEFFKAVRDPDGGLEHKIVIIDRFRLNANDYWEALRQSAFHIWTCGYIQPYCHNQVESIFCGTVPISDRRIAYPGINEQNSCLYSDFYELAEIVEELLKTDINSDRVTEMNRRINRAYMDHFSNQAFRNKMNAFLNSDQQEETYYICYQINA